MIFSMAISSNWGSFKGSCRAPFKGFGVDIRQVKVDMTIGTIWLLL